VAFAATIQGQKFGDQADQRRSKDHMVINIFAWKN